MQFEVRPVRPKDHITFHCQLCGRCCRGIENAVMLEPMDVYRISRYLREQDEPLYGTEDVLAQYAQPILLADILPIYAVNAVGEDKHCVFLKDGRCRIYAARPRTCRIYPFSVGPGERGRDFVYELCLDYSHHFNGGTVSVKDWFYTNFSKEERTFVKADYDAVSHYGKELRRIGQMQFQQLLFQYLYHRYYRYDLTQPFLPQFLAGHEELKKLLADCPDEGDA